MPSEEPHRIGLFRLLLLIPEYYRKAGTCVKGILTLVRTTLGDASAGTVPLDFMVARRGTRWQITDVMMDGESLSKVVSAQIQNAVQTEGYQKLIEELQKQNTLAEAGARGE